MKKPSLRPSDDIENVLLKKLNAKHEKPLYTLEFDKVNNRGDIKCRLCPHCFCIGFTFKRSAKEPIVWDDIKIRHDKRLH
jgi:hypothetical protein